MVLITFTTVRVSHPTRGAWIEIAALAGGVTSKRRRTPHGVRGLKYNQTDQQDQDQSRTPHGVRGLKLYQITGCGDWTRSHPTRGAWIEIREFGEIYNSARVAPHTGCVD